MFLSVCEVFVISVFFVFVLELYLWLNDYPWFGMGCFTTLWMGGEPINILLFFHACFLLGFCEASLKIDGMGKDFVLDLEFPHFVFHCTSIILIFLKLILLKENWKKHRSFKLVPKVVKKSKTHENGIIVMYFISHCLHTCSYT